MIKQHITTVVLTVSALVIIVLLGIRGLLPPAPEHLEHTVTRRYVEAARCHGCNPRKGITQPTEEMNKRTDDNAENFVPVIISTFKDAQILGIETENLRFRQVVAQDVDTIYEYARKPIVAQRTVWAAHATKFDTIQLVDGWLNAYKKYGVAPWAVEEKATGTLIGTAGFSEMYSTEPRIVTSYAVADSAWGNGYELEIQRALIEFACVYIKCIRVEALARCDDPFSQKIREQAGMSLEGDEPDYKRVGSQYVSMHRYAVLRRDIMSALSCSVLQQ